MPLGVGWLDISLRLLLTFVAAALIGLDREARGHNAGLRTTILVGLAAAVAMIQANILLAVGGKTPASFSVLDLMRLPLGILTGVGFIGGGAILRKGDLVEGVTTASTLWITTVIGLCFGGGQLALGSVATVLTLFTIVFLKRIDELIPRKHSARVEFKDYSRCGFEELRNGLGQHGYEVWFEAQDFLENTARVKVSWTCREASCEPERLVALLTKQEKLKAFEMVKESGH